ncbi:hypothetical protein IC607_10115 [Cellulomonas sp. JH27-2]|uniref:hypothetical protein n=1 Tax=Cellulomonas sp. JH27-2 TaxID=2774139 RepID=UPI001782C123|nr:hypothetical protein [Cellulomonas sp. JH27-2]MBD8059321.1 hypothetical protein [Cellulomonas sp. JH27-2]
MSEDTTNSGTEGVLDEGRTAQIVEGEVSDGATTGGTTDVLDEGETADVAESGHGEPTKAP